MEKQGASGVVHEISSIDDRHKTVEKDFNDVTVKKVISAHAIFFDITHLPDLNDYKRVIGYAGHVSVAAAKLAKEYEIELKLIFRE